LRQLAIEENSVPVKKRGRGRVAHGFICIIAFCVIFSILLVYYGPFTNCRNYIVARAMGADNTKFLATAFLSQEEINSILAITNPITNDGQEQISNIQVKTGDSSNSVAGNIQIIDITGKNYTGKLMVVPDPSKITVGVAPELGKIGSPLSEIVKDAGAIGGINAGGFLDDNFVGTGANPDGIVIKNGSIAFQTSDTNKFQVVGFNKNNVLVVSNSMTISEIKSANLRCAISFGPALVLNGQSLVSSGGTSLQPRTAIGQRQDGTVLLLVIDGRQSGSAGANLSDVADIMLKYGAYNAGNLDGGSSATMNYQGKTLNNPCDIAGERSIATAFLVTK
jgi:Exopolysaccharide biosynthesis protein related to N-acetylglucosamine-1-phosphodiester alpha-N-acetylglucosaminidase